MPKSAKPDKKTRRMQTAQVLAERASGKTYEEIAGKFDMCRQTISKILNSKEAEAIVRQAESDTTRLVSKALERVEKVLEDYSDNTNALKAALAVLKSKGVIKDSVDVNHQFPEPTVIRLNGKDQMILGAKKDDDED